MIFGPDGSTQALYYTTYANGGQIRRIAFAQQQNHPPTAGLTTDITFGWAPEVVPSAVDFRVGPPLAGQAAVGKSVTSFTSTLPA
jgi:hypothetical protein